MKSKTKPAKTHMFKDNSFTTISLDEIKNSLIIAEKEKRVDQEAAITILCDIEEKLSQIQDINFDKSKSVESKFKNKPTGEKKYLVKKAEILYALKYYQEAVIIFERMFKNLEKEKEYFIYKFEADCMSKMEKYPEALRLYFDAITVYKNKFTSNDSDKSDKSDEFDNIEEKMQQLRDRILIKEDVWKLLYE